MIDIEDPLNQFSILLIGGVHIRRNGAASHIIDKDWLLLLLYLPSRLIEEERGRGVSTL